MTFQSIVRTLTFQGLWLSLIFSSLAAEAFSLPANPSENLSNLTTAQSAWLASCGTQDHDIGGSGTKKTEEAAKEVYAQLISKKANNCLVCHSPENEDETGAPSDLFSTFLNFKNLATSSPDGFSSALKRMPPDPDDKEYPSKAVSESQLKTLRVWLEEQQQEKLEEEKTFITTDMMLACIQQDLKKIHSTDASLAKKTRYFTLTHLHNAGLNDQLSLYQNGVSFLMNSLSWRLNVVRPKAVDQDGTILRINTDDYAWRFGQWKHLAQKDPYPIAPFSQEGLNAMRLARELSDTKAPAIRGDWFVRVGSSPVPSKIANPGVPQFKDGLYELLLFGSLGGLDGLQTFLDLNIAESIRMFEAKRAATIKSGVSNAQRIIERHSLDLQKVLQKRDERLHSKDLARIPDANRPAFRGYFWSSYDYLDRLLANKDIKEPQANLGHAGGEFLFSLPNGGQGYYLAESDGTRLDSVPKGIASNKLDRKNQHIVWNGFSCMGCHNQGIFQMKLGVKDGFVDYQNNYANEFATQMYPAPEEIQKLFTKDTEQFNYFAKKALYAGSQTPNAVFEGHKLHTSPVTPRQAAAEFGVTEQLFRRAFVNAGLDKARNLDIAKIEREIVKTNYRKILTAIYELKQKQALEKRVFGLSEKEEKFRGKLEQAIDELEETIENSEFLNGKKRMTLAEAKLIHKGRSFSFQGKLYHYNPGQIVPDFSSKTIGDIRIKPGHINDADLKRQLTQVIPNWRDRVVVKDGLVYSWVRLAPVRVPAGTKTYVTKEGIPLALDTDGNPYRIIKP